MSHHENQPHFSRHEQASAPQTELLHYYEAYDAWREGYYNSIQDTIALIERGHYDESIKQMKQPNLNHLEIQDESSLYFFAAIMENDHDEEFKRDLASATIHKDLIDQDAFAQAYDPVDDAEPIDYDNLYAAIRQEIDEGLERMNSQTTTEAEVINDLFTTKLHEFSSSITHNYVLDRHAFIRDFIDP